jgi:nucleoside-diphosphate-sugar epimerase
MDSNAQPRRVWIIGCGDVGCRLALRLHSIGVSVLGFVRSAASASALERLAIVAQQWDLDTTTPKIGTAEATGTAPDWIFYFAPPPNVGVTETRLRAFLAARDEPPKRLIYLSTSAVYGDCAGAWIDETAPTQPQNDRGRRRLDGEQTALAYAARTGCSALILRVPGIYGPGRLPVARLRAGTPVLRNEESPYTNRIHADDLAAAALRVAEYGAAGAAYNVSDGQPTTMTDYFLRCADLLSLAPPPQISLIEARSRLSPMLMSFLEESKRLDTRRLVETLGWRAQYRDLASGLPTCLAADVVAETLHASQVQAVAAQ